MQAELRIILNHDGSVRIGGPISDKILCYGMLELAKEAIKSHSEGPKLVQPGPELSSLLSARNGK